MHFTVPRCDTHRGGLSEPTRRVSLTHDLYGRAAGMTLRERGHARKKNTGKASNMDASISQVVHGKTKCVPLDAHERMERFLIICEGQSLYKMKSWIIPLMYNLFSFINK